MSTRCLVTCEHGGNRVPAAYRRHFAGHESLLDTHRGYDPGALALARRLAAALGAPLFYATVSRLVVDLNRSPGHPRLYSEATRPALPAVRREILESHYLPYRQRVEGAAAEAIAEGEKVIHLSAHSFTPELDGEERDADIGLLYDPARPGETELARRWQAALKDAAPELRVRRNYPYRGKSDGFTAYLRRRFPAEAYVGIELEINQQQVFRDGKPWRQMQATITAALLQALK